MQHNGQQQPQTTFYIFTRATGKSITPPVTMSYDEKCTEAAQIGYPNRYGGQYLGITYEYHPKGARPLHLYAHAVLEDTEWKDGVHVLDNKNQKKETPEKLRMLQSPLMHLHNYNEALENFVANIDMLKSTQKPVEIYTDYKGNPYKGEIISATKKTSTIIDRSYAASIPLVYASPTLIL